MESLSTLPEPVLLATRELWWNVGPSWSKLVFYILAFASVAIFCYGIYGKYKRISSGKKLKETRTENPKQRLLSFLKHTLLQSKILRQKVPGIAHALTLFGFLTLWIVTDIIAVQEHLVKDFYFFQGLFYKIVSFAADLGGLLLFLGVIVFSIRRYVYKSKKLDNTQLDWIQPAFLLAFVITGFTLEGLRMAATDNIEVFAPIGAVLGTFCQFMTPEDLVHRHQQLWWFHAVLTFVFIALIPYTKFIHIFLSPLSIFFKSSRARGQLSTPFSLLELMEAETNGSEVNEADFTAGVFEAKDLSWKTLLDSEACTACGRCHVVCPAQNTDKPLSPKFLMLDIKALATKDNPQEIYSHISPEVLWSCTSCGACVEECPVLIEHVDTIVDMRRGLLQSNQAPSNLQATLKNLRTKSNPWGLDPNDREKWITELKTETGIDVKIAKQNKNNFEYLYWVGSPGAYEDKNKQVTKANAQLFFKAGLNFAVLGNEEKTSGDLARRSGDEGLYQEIVLENITILQSYGVKKIITQCPHAFNTFKNEYPEFGLAGVEVYHHTEILAKLLQEGKLQTSKSIDEVITYHDPCYLGRYNDVFDAPRYILESIPGLTIKGIEHEKKRSTCCGGGGAQMWYETTGSHINAMRLDELNQHTPNKVSVACPYCSIMLTTATTTAFPGTNIPIIEDVAVTLAKSVC